MTTMTIDQIVRDIRQVELRLAGCPLDCEGRCWSACTERDVDEVEAEILDARLPLTICGGEPFDQAVALVDLIFKARIQNPDLHVTIRTCLAIEDILDVLYEVEPLAAGLLRLADVLVDGEGRRIDLPATFETGWDRLVLVGQPEPAHIAVPALELATISS